MSHILYGLPKYNFALKACSQGPKLKCVYHILNTHTEISEIWGFVCEIGETGFLLYIYFCDQEKKVDLILK